MCAAVSYVLPHCGHRNELKKDDREWARALWNRWFDQVFPPTPPSTEDEEEEDEEEEDLIDVPIIQPVEEEEDKSKRKGSIVYAPADAEVYPVTMGPDDDEGVQVCSSNCFFYFHPSTRYVTRTL